MLQFLRLWCDLGTPFGFRHMNSWSGNTYRLVAANGTWVYTRVKVATDQGIRNMTDAEAMKIAGVNDAWATQDLYDSIERGEHPSWTVYMQVLTPKDAKKWRYNILDLTKDWVDVPYHEIGKLVVNQNPANFYAEVEQLHFSVSNMIEGWEPSNDPMLQSRMFSYNDAARYRLGPNYNDIPVNCPFAPIANYQRDGMVQSRGNQGRRPNYPTIRDKYQIMSRPATVVNQPLQGTETEYFEWPMNDDLDWEQPREFYDSFSSTDKDHLHTNIASTLLRVKDQVVIDTLMPHFERVSPELSQGISTAMKNERKKG